MPSRSEGHQGSVKDPEHDGRLKQNRDNGRTKSTTGGSGGRGQSKGGTGSNGGNAPAAQLQEMLIDQLRDARSAETQAIQGMKKTLRKTSHPDLKAGIEAHIEQSENQRERVDQALELAGGKQGRKVCEAMRGLIEEGQHELEEHETGLVLDLVIVGSLQRIEHYEIAAYGTMVEYCKAAGHEDIADILSAILEEEKTQDQLLTELTRSTLLPAALEVDEEEETADEDETVDG